MITLSELGSMLKTKYTLVNSHQSLNASNFNILWNVSVPRDFIQFLNTLRLAMQVATDIYVQGMIVS